MKGFVGAAAEMARYGMAAKCRKFGKMHAFCGHEECYPAVWLLPMGAAAFACHNCDGFERDAARVKDMKEFCRHLLVSYMRTDEEEKKDV